MPRYIAFLRAINVGSHIVKMERLRALFEELGFSKVETFINSGNVIFESSSKSEEALRKKIEKQLEQALGYEVETFLRADAELAKIAAESGNAEKGMFVVFLTETPLASLQEKLLNTPTEVDRFAFRGREIYWNCSVNFSDSKFSGARLEKMLGVRATVRGANTVRKLAAKYPPQ